MLTRAAAAAAAANSMESKEGLFGAQATNIMSENPQTSLEQKGAVSPEAQTRRTTLQVSDHLKVDDEFRRAILRYLGLPADGQDPVADFCASANSTVATTSKTPTSDHEWGIRDNRMPNSKVTASLTNQHGQTDIAPSAVETVVDQAMQTLAPLMTPAKGLKDSKVGRKVAEVMETLATILDDGLQAPSAQQTVAARSSIPLMSAKNSAHATSGMYPSVSTSTSRVFPEAVSAERDLGARPKIPRVRRQRKPSNPFEQDRTSFEFA